jgi:hypothetical protein
VEKSFENTFVKQKADRKMLVKLTLGQLGNKLVEWMAVVQIKPFSFILAQNF